MNARSEVISEEVKQNGAVNATKAREYGWDNGWNRTEAKTGGLTTTYSYASPSANQISSTTGHEAATFTYDEDGNLTSDGTWTYTYDAENRLKSASTSSYNAGFIYDYAGRRVRKSGLNGPFFFSTTYVYDGWNLIAELDQSLNPTRTYTWGPDANGEIGVSGAGGLLMISSGSNRWYPTYDARHNVTGLVDASGNFVAAYTYDAFGRITAQAGTQAANNPFGFATQFTDRDTGLIYFGHRFYSPKLGRFINRDPIAEAGGANLYAYAGNQVSDTCDVLGLLPMPDRLGGIFGDTGIFGDGLLGFGVNIGLRDTFNQLVSNYVWRTYLRVRHREERNRRIHSTYSAAELEQNPAVPAANRQPTPQPKTGTKTINWTIEDLEREVKRSPRARQIMEKRGSRILLTSADGAQVYGVNITVSKNYSLEQAIVAVFHELGHQDDPNDRKVQRSVGRYQEVEKYIAARAETEVKAITSENDLIRDYRVNGGTMDVRPDSRFYDPETGTTRADAIRNAIISGQLESGGRSYRERYIEEWEAAHGPLQTTPPEPSPPSPQPRQEGAIRYRGRGQPRRRPSFRIRSPLRFGCGPGFARASRLSLLLIIGMLPPSAFCQDPLREAVIRNAESDYALFLRIATDYRMIPVDDSPFKEWATYRCQVLGGSEGPINFFFGIKDNVAIILTGNLDGLNQVIAEENMTVSLSDRVLVELLTLIRPTDRRYWRLGFDPIKPDRISNDALGARGLSLDGLVASSGKLVAPGVRRFFVIERTSLLEQDVYLSNGSIALREKLLLENVIKVD